MKLFENESVSEFSVQSSTPDKMPPENSVRRATELCGMAEPPNSGEALKSESRSNNSLTDQVSPYSNIDNNGFNSHENDTKDLTTSSSDVQKDELNKSITLKVKVVR